MRDSLKRFFFSQKEVLNQGPFNQPPNFPIMVEKSLSLTSTGPPPGGLDGVIKRPAPWILSGPPTRWGPLRNTSKPSYPHRFFDEESEQSKCQLRT